MRLDEFLDAAFVNWTVPGSTALILCANQDVAKGLYCCALTDYVNKIHPDALSIRWNITRQWVHNQDGGRVYVMGYSAKLIQNVAGMEFQTIVVHSGTPSWEEMDYLLARLRRTPGGSTADLPLVLLTPSGSKIQAR